MSRPLVWTFRSRITFVRAITQINQEEKTTILLATHDLSDICLLYTSWLTYIEHSKISISAYYLSKIFRVLLNFMVAIIVTFCVGAFVRDVELPLSGWLGSGALLLLSSLVFLAFGLLIAQIKSQQIMSVVANITYLGLAIVGGSWMPISMFPKWVQSISEWTPVYRINELVVNFAINGEFSWK